MIADDLLSLLEVAAPKLRPRKDFVAGVVAALVAVPSPGADAAPSAVARVGRVFSRKVLVAAAGGASLVLVIGMWQRTPAQPVGDRDQRTPAARHAIAAEVDARASARKPPREAPLANAGSASGVEFVSAASVAGRDTLTFDFQDGEQLETYANGLVTDCPAREAGERCLVGETFIRRGEAFNGAYISDAKTWDLFRYSSNLVLSFDYYLVNPVDRHLKVMVSHNPPPRNRGPRARVGGASRFVLAPESVVEGRWTHVDLSLAEVGAIEGRTERRMQEGDRISWLGVVVHAATDTALVVDNVKITARSGGD
jgi:hypothetical protein